MLHCALFLQSVSERKIFTKVGPDDPGDRKSG